MDRADIDGVADDARALNRALGVQALGYVLKAGLPFLLALATRTYGAATWGVFVAVQTLVLMAVRFGLLGLDKATLWWVGAHDPRHMRRALIPALLLSSLSSVLTALVLAVAGEPIIARWDGASGVQVSALRIALIGLPLLAISEVLLNASMGQRKMGLQVAVRDTLVPTLWLVAALVFHWLGLHETGLCWAFVLSNGTGLLVAAVIVLRAPSDHGPVSLRLPPELVRYAVPSWLNEMANTAILRVDTLVLAAVADPFSVGIWGVIVQFGNAMRSIRRAFDPILIAVTARISRAHDPERLAHALSYATQLVSLTQLPVFVFILLFAGELLPLYGQGFGQGSVALCVLCGFWLLSGSLSLTGVVLAGYGHARLNLMLTVIGLVLLVPLLFLVVPPYGLVGAALAVGVTNLVQLGIQLLLLRQKVGGWPYNERARRSLAPTLAAGTAMAATWLGLRAAAAPGLTRSVGAFAVFLCVYGLMVGLQWKRGLLRAPGLSA
jgi:O-antigen/teichoic acid export membrane protein